MIYGSHMQSVQPDQFNRHLFDRITPKQRECLDLVLERKTSKQISRILRISKPAVDQRLATARQSLGAVDRDDAVMIYARMLATYDRVAYDSMQLPPVAQSLQSDEQDRASAATLTLHEAPTSFGNFERGPVAAFDVLGVSLQELSLVARLVVIVAFCVGILASLLIGLAVAQSLSRLLGS